ncbi:hypothetical protein Tdes44962_MAKER08669 [Teratosphaeria destructans]|uniref:Uncharacterized protein n=1 Tax=Teratosphaeria destructans TaxID=418781 RepID=A0A9W7SW03_9PEZI|nr:hypothetical protein Tdes44962_MAKER08669 [Teratosphaeria destructans]
MALASTPSGSTATPKITPSASYPSSFATSVVGAVSTQSTLTSRPTTSDRTSASATSSPAKSSPTSTTAASPSGHGLTHWQKQITIATIVIAGTLFVAMLLCILLRRRRGALRSGIQALRPFSSSTVLYAPPDQADRLTALPIYQQTRISVRSSIHNSQTSAAKWHKSSVPVPPEVAKRYHPQSPWVKSSWMTRSAAPKQPVTPTRDCDTETSFLMDASPPRCDSRLQTLEMARTNDSVVTPSSATRHAPGSVPRGMRVLVTGPSAGSAREGGDFASTPASPGSRQDMPDRWSWTNSNAPPTPRYAPSLRSSISSLPRFRTIKSWVLGQSARVIPEHPPPERPGTSASTRKPLLKNQASIPSLAPLAATSFTGHGRVGSISSIFQPNSGSTETTLGSPGPTHDFRPIVSTPSVEMRQQRAE